MKSSGFSLIELMAVILIIVLLGGTTAVVVGKRVDKAKRDTAGTQINNFNQSIEMFYLDCGFNPTSLQDLVTEPVSGRTCKGWTPGYIKGIPNDPWGNPFNFESPGVHNTTSYDIWSNGPDGEEGTSDDITNWTTEAP